jgi:hypothetical protein
MSTEFVAGKATTPTPAPTQSDAKTSQLNDSTGPSVAKEVELRPFRSFFDSEPTPESDDMLEYVLEHGTDPTLTKAERLKQLTDLDLKLGRKSYEDRLTKVFNHLRMVMAVREGLSR